jgi:hypothetical protein
LRGTCSLFYKLAGVAQREACIRKMLGIFVSESQHLVLPGFLCKAKFVKIIEGIGSCLVHETIGDPWDPERVVRRAGAIGGVET